MKFQKMWMILGAVLSASVLAGSVQADESEEILQALPGIRPLIAIKCPAPSEVKCRAQSVGDWLENGGVRANSAFAPNDQCANVIKINENGNLNRLLCCYEDCGVLYKDVKFKSCMKVSVSEFRCQ